MAQGLIIWLVTFLISYFIIGAISQRFATVQRRLMVVLFLYHSAMAVAYYWYALLNPSDSKGYFSKVLIKYAGDDWFNYFGVSTKFIEFIAFFLVNRLGFTYESTMVVFSWFGFLGFLLFYIFIRERVFSAPKLFGFDVVLIIFLLPNLHFWASSLGKGSLIFMGFGLFFFAINKPGPRLWALLLGGWIIFQIRPHIFFIILIAVTLGYTFSTKGVALGYRLIILIGAVFLLYNIYEDVLLLTGLEDESITDPLFSHRASELSKATSGIDIVNYSIPEKLFAFWFRPLFFDVSGILGFIVSFENLFYLFFFLRLFRPSALRFLITSDAIVKTCLMTFFGVSFALAQISGNLGLAMRQKSQVMILMLFVIVKFMDEKRITHARNILSRKRMREKLVSQRTRNLV